ncbi:MAG TPA: hypothetical protein VK921_18580 [Anditalea sp.]|nr:hypothetical protein [Anditalea sp.]
MTQDIYLLFIFLAIVASVFYYFKNEKRYLNTNKIILGLLVFVLLFEIAGNYTANRNINNLLLYNICWVYLESLLIIGYFYMMHKQAMVKRVIMITGSIVLLISLLNGIWLESFVGEFQYNSFAMFSILILGLCLHFLFQIQKFKVYQNHNILAVPHFWIVVGIFFFYLEALITFGVIFNVVGLEHRIVFGLMYFNRIMAAAMYIFLGFSFYSQYLFKNPSKGLIADY